MQLLSLWMGLDSYRLLNAKLTLLGWVENIAEKGENAGYQYFSPFPTMFSKGVFFRVVKSINFVVKS